MIQDPRKPRGIRHRFESISALAFLGLFCRRTDFASSSRWARDHWRTLQGSLGFTRKTPPHATTISRVVAKFSLEQFREAFAFRLVGLSGVVGEVDVAVDGKTSKQGHDAEDDPIHMLNGFTHELGLCLARFPVTAGKPTEPQALKAGRTELLEHYPFVRIFTGDAFFTQRPSAKAILEAGRDFLFTVKEHRPELLEAIQTSFPDAETKPPDVESKEKKGAKFTPESSGSSKAKRLNTSARQSRSPALS